jgi:hypothetical protein
VGHVESQLGMAPEILHQLEIAQDSRSIARLRSLKRTIAYEHA